MDTALEKKLSNLSLPGLVEAQEFVQELITTKKAEEKNTLLDDLKARAKEAGFDWDELVGEGKGKLTKKRGSVPPKYCNPNDPKETWSGRGRKPHWVIQVIEEEGKKLDDLLIEA
ncbi:H-NS histone family protein [Candidatus Woesearchaeota archaeon]|nr:H-NS histone family protein [Candidatus Woesearchaeota archaeon]